MKKILTTSLTSLGVLAGSVLLAPTAHAITNPASNPHPIVVKGDDGRTYEDGRDTLPGYDDEECSYIPGAWFDFDNNRVNYADGQSIPWTEWERIPGYKQWQAKQQEKKEETPAPSGGSSSGSTGKTGGSSSGKSGGSSQGKSGSSGSGTSGTSGTGSAGQPSGGTGSSDAATGTATDDPTVGTTTEESGEPGKKRAKRKGASEAEAADESVETVDGTFVAATADDDTQAAAQSGNGSGLVILASLLVGGLALVGGYGVFGGRRRQKTS